MSEENTAVNQREQYGDNDNKNLKKLFHSFPYLSKTFRRQLLPIRAQANPVYYTISYNVRNLSETAGLRPAGGRLDPFIISP